MKKLLLALSLFSYFVISGLAFADSDIQNTTINATTYAPIYTLDDKPVLGRVENVYLNSIESLEHIPFAGKIDTGADTTSIHATNIHITSSHSKFKDLQDTALMEALISTPEIDDVTYDDWDAELFAPYQSLSVLIWKILTIMR